MLHSKHMFHANKYVPWQVYILHDNYICFIANIYVSWTVNVFRGKRIQYIAWYTGIS